MRKVDYSIHLRSIRNATRTLRTYVLALKAQLEQILTENRLIDFSPSPLETVLRLLSKRLGELQQREPVLGQAEDERLLTIGKLQLRIKPVHSSLVIRAYYRLRGVIACNS